MRRIIRGYRKRDRLKLQMLAEVAYTNMYMMRDPQGKKVADIFPSLFEEDEEEVADPLTDEDRAELQALIDAENAHLL